VFSGSGAVRTPVVLGALAVACLLAMLAAVRFGSTPLSTSEVLEALRGTGDAGARAIVVDLRLPRVVQSALVGAALAASGTALQALLRNPLAEPYVLGISSGAAVGAVGSLVFGLGVFGAATTGVTALVGALLALVTVLAIARAVGGALDPRTLVLGGVITSAFLNALLLLALVTTDLERYRAAFFWLLGSNAGASWGNIAGLTVVTVAGLAWLLARGRALDALAIGEETAQHLGVRAGRVRLEVLLVASVLTAASVSVAGTVGFVGLVVPHMLRFALAPTQRVHLVASAVGGACFLVLADLAGRAVAPPNELPLGAVTALLGAPVFTWLLVRGERARLA
jgi:iron complex transport system permease protein